MKKSILAIVLGLVFIFTLSACSSNNDDATEEEVQIPATENVQDQAGDTTTDEEENGPETGDFKGLEVQDDIVVEVEDGDVVVGG